MPVDHNIEELENLILDTVDYYEDDLPRRLAAFVSDIELDLKGGNYKNRTGDLRRSIQAKLIDYNISIKMLPYGYFISFGVEGGKYRALGLPEEVRDAFGTNKFKSKKRKAWGIRPRKFYPDDLEERLLNILTDDNG